MSLRSEANIAARLNKRLQSAYRYRYLFVVIALITITLAFYADDMMRVLVRKEVTSGEISFAQFISRFSDWPVLITLLLSGAGVLFKSKRADAGRLLVTLAIAGLVSGLTATTIRSLTGRARPSSHQVPGFYGLWHGSQLLVGNHEFNSFPSGHTATAAGVAGALLFLGWRAGLLGFSFAVVVAWSRMALNCHFFSDVIVSLFLGVIGGWLTWYWVLPRLEQKFEELLSASHPVRPKEQGA